MEVDQLMRNIQAQILVDRLDWISETVYKKKACPRCNQELVNTGPETITSPFIDFISPKLLPV